MSTKSIIGGVRKKSPSSFLPADRWRGACLNKKKKKNCGDEIIDHITMAAKKEKKKRKIRY